MLCSLYILYISNGVGKQGIYARMRGLHFRNITQHNVLYRLCVVWTMCMNHIVFEMAIMCLLISLFREHLLSTATKSSSPLCTCIFLHNYTRPYIQVPMLIIRIAGFIFAIYALTYTNQTCECAIDHQSEFTSSDESDDYIPNLKSRALSACPIN